MVRLIFSLACAVTLAGCTMVKLNSDNTTTITHKAGDGVGQELATRACRKAGESSAVIISTMNKDASLPDGTGRQVTTFRCSSDRQPPPSP